MIREFNDEDKKQLVNIVKQEIIIEMETLQNSLCIVNYKIDHYKEIGIFHIDQ